MSIERLTRQSTLTLRDETAQRRVLRRWPLHLPSSPSPASQLKRKLLRMKNCILGVAVPLLIACTAPLTLLTPESTVEGASVGKAAIRVNQPFTFRPALYLATFPAGLYVPKFEDKEGVFFKAPDQLLAQTVAGGRTMQGGLYVSKQSWSRYRAYIDESGEIYKFDITVPIDITVVKQP